jgi:molybdenum cofactor sulfurtransferase
VGKSPWFRRKEVLHECLEDSTLPFHAIIVLGVAIDMHERLYGPDPIEKIASHTAFLEKYLYDSITSLRYLTGRPICHIYKGERCTFGDNIIQETTMAFNVVGRRSNFIPYTSVADKLANEGKTFVRTGHLCNPGGFATILGFDEGDMRLLWDHGHYRGSVSPLTMEILNGRPTVVVRVSLGAMTTKANVDNLITFLRDEFATSAQLVTMIGLRPVITFKMISAS